MLLSTTFILVLISTSLTQQAVKTQLRAASTKSSSYSSKLCHNQGYKLSLIRQAQEEQQRKLTRLEFRVNNVLSKLISIPEHSGNYYNKTLQYWSNQFAGMFQKFEETIKKILLNSSLEQIQFRPKTEVITDKDHKEVDKCKNNHEHIRQQVSAGNESNKSKGTKQELMAVAYIQPAIADCCELDEEQRVDGVYKLLESELNEVQRDYNERYCAFATTGPAWTVIQRRNHLENFNGSWDEYRTGFGSLTGDFWFGNEFIHKMVYRDDFVLRVELEDHQGVQVWAEYGVFRLDSDSYNYQLIIDQLNENSTASDALTYSNRMDFQILQACNGWWFNPDDDDCLYAKSNLNGNSIIWGNQHNKYSLKSSRMLIRPRNLHLDIIVDVYDEDSI